MFVANADKCLVMHAMSRRGVARDQTIRGKGLRSRWLFVLIQSRALLSNFGWVGKI